MVVGTQRDHEMSFAAGSFRSVRDYHSIRLSHARGNETQHHEYGHWCSLIDGADGEIC